MTTQIKAPTFISLTERLKRIKTVDDISRQTGLAFRQAKAIKTKTTATFLECKSLEAKLAASKVFNPIITQAEEVGFYLRINAFEIEDLINANKPATDLPRP